MNQDAPTTRRSADPRAVVIAGMTTLAWYAVPDVVRPRWARALAKTAVATVGVVLTVTSTAEGRDARAGVRDVRDAIRSAAEGTGDPDAEATPDPPREDNTYVPDRDDEEVPVPPGLLAAGAFGGLALATALAVAGEKWAYRRGERLRDRGVRLPHARVGLALGGLAAALAAIEPFLWNAEADEVADPDDT